MKSLEKPGGIIATGVLPPHENSSTQKDPEELLQNMFAAGYSRGVFIPSKDQHMPASQRIAVVDSAVNAVVVPCGEKQPAQISHYPPPVSSTSVYAVVSPPGVGISG
ncbi:hypothetical protein [Pseudomonas sp. BIGb0164]|uniref:hypothetical protein n=1 Tax=Pseudomonas sp. BIGb0164 TaxID=2940605 RepID=UPI002166F365|nr:hypothetical protein [Pseudomonas sp. BIGb0164]MCS4248632.1 hypothetical protein [Pseudomonas sp. BIGb0164]